MNKTIKTILKYSYFIVAFAVYIYFVPLISLMNESQSIGWTGNEMPNFEYVLFLFCYLLILPVGGIKLS